MQTLYSTSEQETEVLAERLAHTLKGREVIALFGGMGMGKTAFARGLARGLGVTDGVSSPTFALVNEYEGTEYRLYHFDMYRITSYDDLYTTGFFDYQDTGILLIEWSENIEPFLPQERINITFHRVSDHERKLTVEGAEIP